MTNFQGFGEDYGSTFKGRVPELHLQEVLIRATHLPGVYLAAKALIREELISKPSCVAPVEPRLECQCTIGRLALNALRLDCLTSMVYVCELGESIDAKKSTFGVQKCRYALSVGLTGDATVVSNYGSYATVFTEGELIEAIGKAWTTVGIRRLLFSDTREFFQVYGLPR